MKADKDRTIWQNNFQEVSSSSMSKQLIWTDTEEKVKRKTKD